MTIFRFFNLLRIRRIKRSIHTGIGYDMGDGVDIEDKIIEFAWRERRLGSLCLYRCIRTEKNVYHLKGIFGGYIWIRGKDIEAHFHLNENH